MSQSTKCVDVVQGEPVTLDEAACTAAGGGINWCSGDGTCCSTAWSSAPLCAVILLLVAFGAF